MPAKLTRAGLELERRRLQHPRRIARHAFALGDGGPRGDVEDAPTDEEWEQRLIKTLKSTYYSTSTDPKVSTGTFLTDKGILIKLVVS